MYVFIYLFIHLQPAALTTVVHNGTTEYRGIFHDTYRGAKSLVLPNTKK